jgi:hypothetical protein
MAATMAAPGPGGQGGRVPAFRENLPVFAIDDVDVAIARLQDDKVRP